MHLLITLLAVHFGPGPIGTEHSPQTHPAPKASTVHFGPGPIGMNDEETVEEKSGQLVSSDFSSDE